MIINHARKNIINDYMNSGFKSFKNNDSDEYIDQVINYKPILEYEMLYDNDTCLVIFFFTKDVSKEIISSTNFKYYEWINTCSKLPTTNSNSKEVTTFAFYADRHFCQKGREVYISNEKNEIKVKFYVKDGYGKTRNKSFNLKYVDFDSIENIMPGIDKAMYKEKKII